MRLLLLLAMLLWAFPASAVDPYSRLTAYAGLLHVHVGTLEGMARQYGTKSDPAYPDCDTGDPRDSVEGASDCPCNNDAHAFGHPYNVYLNSIDAGLDFVNISHHTGATWYKSTTELTALTTAIGSSGTFAELGTDDAWVFCDPASDGLAMANGTDCTRDGSATDLEWLYEQASLAMTARPGTLALVGMEWTVSADPPSSTAQEGGHKIIATDGDTPVSTFFIPNTSDLTQDGVYVPDEVGVYRIARENRLFMQNAHPCSDGSGLSYLGPVDYSTGGGFDPRVMFGHEVGTYGGDNCLKASEAGDPTNCDPGGGDLDCNNRGAVYFNLLDKGYHLYPAAADDNHHHPVGSGHSQCSYQEGLTSGDQDRSIIWADSLTYPSLFTAMKARRGYWAKQGKPLAKVYAYDEPGGTTSAPDAIMGGFVQSTDDDFTLEASVTSDGATFSDMEVWHNGAEVLDDAGSADITCTASLCTIDHEFTSDVDGWWLLVVISAAGKSGYEVITAPIWVNRNRANFLGAPLVSADRTPE